MDKSDECVLISNYVSIRCFFEWTELSLCKTVSPVPKEKLEMNALCRFVFLCLLLQAYPALLWICGLSYRITDLNCPHDTFRHLSSSWHALLHHFCILVGALNDIRQILYFLAFQYMFT